MKKIYSYLILAGILLLSSATLSAQLVAYYQFNETSDSLIVDSSPNNNFAYANCDTCWADGMFDGGFKFSGEHKITLGAEYMGMTSEKGSVAFWMLVPEITDINCIFWAGEFGGDMFGSQNETHIHMEGPADNVWAGGEVSFFLRDSVAGKNYFLYSDPWDGGLGNPPSENVITLDDSTWHHVTATWETGKVALYIDGQPVWDTTAYEGATWDYNLMTIGAANQRANRTYTGYMDEFRIYDRALFSDEVLDLFNFNGIEDSKALNGGMKINNFPNPFSESTTIRYNVSMDSQVNIDIYNQAGQKVRSFNEGRRPVGQHTVVWNGDNDSGQELASGVYYIQLRAGQSVETGKVLLMK